MPAFFWTTDVALTVTEHSTSTRFFKKTRNFPRSAVPIGMAVYPQNRASAQELVELADEHLCPTKHACRVQSATASAPEFALGRLRGTLDRITQPQ